MCVFVRSSNSVTLDSPYDGLLIIRLKLSSQQTVAQHIIRSQKSDFSLESETCIETDAHTCFAQISA
jgi:hypothetical protein